MTDTIRVEKNPFFMLDMDKICIVCNKKLFKSHSIFDRLSETESNINVFEALKLISNFKQVNIENGPQRICQRCFSNTQAALRFRKLCNNAVSYLEAYLEHQNEMDLKLARSDADKSESLMEIPISKTVTIIIPEKVTVKSELKMMAKEKQTIYSNAVKVKCKICHKFYRNDYLTKHLRVHTGERPYDCKNCNKKFKNATELNSHKVSHSNAQLLCSICGKSFKRHKNLNSHFMTHTGERPHECEICGKTFRAREILRDHVVVHSNEKPFACEICGKCFPAKRHLRQHMISHEEVKRHECRFCGKRFTQAHSLRTHLSKCCKGST